MNETGADEYDGGNVNYRGPGWLVDRSGREYHVAVELTSSPSRMGVDGLYYKWVGLVIEGDVPEALDDEMGLRLPNGLTRRVWAWEMPPGQVWLLGREDPPPIIAEYP